MKTFIDFILHVDTYLNLLIQNYGVGVYFLLFIVVFLETGFVITPFLPGDSLLFVAGTFAGAKILNIYAVFFIFLFAAILGDTVNYWIGNYFGEKVFSKSRLFKKEYLEKTKDFYKKHGAKTIVIARFIPIIRTFAPFVAGIGKMDYKRFLKYNIVGGLAWVITFVLGGYFFGKIPIIQQNLMLAIYIIMVASFIPLIVALIREKLLHKS